MNATTISNSMQSVVSRNNERSQLNINQYTFSFLSGFTYREGVDRFSWIFSMDTFTVWWFSNYHSRSRVSDILFVITSHYYVIQISIFFDFCLVLAFINNIFTSICENLPWDKKLSVTWWFPWLVMSLVVTRRSLSIPSSGTAP